EDLDDWLKARNERNITTAHRQDWLKARKERNITTAHRQDLCRKWHAPKHAILAWNMDKQRS
ncbi:hypothetical protein LINPERHAP1_LOCUS26470, partial [Linum perenne]